MFEFRVSSFEFRVDELVVGANASGSKKDDFYSVAFLPQRQNVFNPDKHVPEPDDSYFIDHSSRGGPVNSVNKQKGVYSVLRLKLADPLTLIAGSRAIHAECRLPDRASTRHQ